MQHWTTFLERQLTVSRQALGDAAAEPEREGKALTVPCALGEAVEITGVPLRQR